jgi:hypothetical protein
MGNPVILSDTCGSYGTDDDVQEEKNGLVYEFGDVKALSECIKTMAVSRELREGYGQFSHELGVVFQSMAHHNAIKRLIHHINSSS